MDNRKRKRLEINTSLIIKKVNESKDKAIGVHILNVSKLGLGFKYNKELEIGAIYEGDLIIWTREKIHIFIEIVRMIDKDEEFIYGAFFIGMPEVDAQRIAIYETVFIKD